MWRSYRVLTKPVKEILDSPWRKFKATPQNLVVNPHVRSVACLHPTLPMSVPREGQNESDEMEMLITTFLLLGLVVPH